MYELGVLKNKDKDCGDMINNTLLKRLLLKNKNV